MVIVVAVLATRRRRPTGDGGRWSTTDSEVVRAGLVAVASGNAVVLLAAGATRLAEVRAGVGVAGAEGRVDAENLTVGSA